MYHDVEINHFAKKLKETNQDSLNKMSESFIGYKENLW